MEISVLFGSSWFFPLASLGMVSLARYAVNDGFILVMFRVWARWSRTSLRLSFVMGSWHPLAP